jgi:5'-phosphate synthase pdxT subunit
MIEEGYECVFIRAPRFERIGDGVEVLGACDTEPVMVRQDNVLMSSFHPELTDDPRVHEWFIKELC